MFKSQHAADVKDQHERHARRKDTKSMKEIHSHLNLQPPHSPIAFEGEESLEIESFEERIARFDIETPMQQWYGYTSFSGFGFDYGSVAGASSSHPPPFDSLLRLILMMMKMKRVKNKMKTMSEAFHRPSQLLLVLNDKGGEKSIKS
jgi:hypothetical protein